MKQLHKACLLNCLKALALAVFIPLIVLTYAYLFVQAI